MQALRVAMPPVSKIESDPDALLRPVEGLPEPLNQWPLPPMIVTEKGESLDSFAARSAPDFFTSLQVCTILQMAFAFQEPTHDTRESQQYCTMLAGDDAHCSQT